MAETKSVAELKAVSRPNASTSSLQAKMADDGVEETKGDDDEVDEDMDEEEKEEDEEEEMPSIEPVDGSAPPTRGGDEDDDMDEEERDRSPSPPPVEEDEVKQDQPATQAPPPPPPEPRAKREVRDCVGSESFQL